MYKTYILDSTVLLAFPRALFAFDENEVIIPSCVLQEIGNAIRHGGDERFNAMEFTKLLDSLYHGGSESISLENGGKLKIINAETILSVARQHGQSIIVSRDASMRLQAKLCGVQAQPYLSDSSACNNPYPGRSCLYVSSEQMQEYAEKGSLSIPTQSSAQKSKAPLRPLIAVTQTGEMLPDNYLPCENEYVTLINSSDPSGATMLGRVKGDKVVPLMYNSNTPVFGVTPRNIAQIFALDALMDPNVQLVVFRGPAGTGKTFLTMAAALEQTVNSTTYRKILLTKPNAKMDMDVGYLKGDEREKVLPGLRGLTDNIDNLFSLPSQKKKNPGDYNLDHVEYLLDTKKIEVQALAYMRGRSISNQFIVVDEMQNSTVTQALSIVTRLGEGSKLVILGDPDQIDNPYLDRQNNGLVYTADRMSGSSLCCQVSFTPKEATRSSLAKEAVRRMSPKGAVFHNAAEL